jgi:flavorubredoxin
MLVERIHSGHHHSWTIFARDPARPNSIIDTNQYAVRAGDHVILLDPGGAEIFPSMLAAVTQAFPVEQIDHLFISHQDPDIGSSLPLWRSVCRPDMATLTAIPDEGGRLRLGGRLELEFVPAHYLHSSGNFNVYDAEAGILFSGDIGAALLPPDDAGGLYVTDFARHVDYMEGFHRRWMGSEAAKLDWVERVSALDVNLMAPQHGKMIKGDDVKRFLDWFAALEIGSGIRRRSA